LSYKNRQYKKSNHIPRKRFGQHFLHDQHVVDQIIRVIAPISTDHLVEIGPGLGVLTKFILPLVGNLEAVELDRDLIPLLAEACKGLGELKIYQANVLKFDFSKLITDHYQLRIFGNLPYNISTPLIFHLLDYIKFIKDMHLMLQKEVAERIAAPPSTEHYGQLSIMVQYHCHAELLFTVNRKSFSPPPRVESAFIRLVPSLPEITANDINKLRDVVRQAFSQRRKMLHNCLKELITVPELEQLGIDPNSRPEQLSVEDFVRISNTMKVK
jgi:16S rRNA (adenine1518-N6/adenine1519-N6)-dimethyltransferase